LRSPVQVLSDILNRVSNRPDWMEHVREDKVGDAL
jgi:hypothetical protein